MMKFKLSHLPRRRIRTLPSPIGEGFLDGALDALQSEVAVLDAQGRILAVNQAWRTFAARHEAQAPCTGWDGTDYLGAVRRAAQAGDGFAGSALQGLERVLAGTLPHFELTYSCPVPGVQRWFRMVASGFKGVRRGALVIHEDITDRVLLEETQLFLARTHWLPGAKDFFKELASFLGRQMDAAFVRIARIAPGGQSVTPLAIWIDGQPAMEGAAPLEGTPCEDLLARQLYWVPDGLGEAYPRDPQVLALGVRSFLGVTIRGRDGQPIGQIGVKKRQPMKDSRVAEAILNVTMERAAGEIERLDGEAAVREASDFSRKLLEAQPIGVLVYHAVTGQCVRATENIAITLGSTVEVLLTQNFLHLESWKAPGLRAAADRTLATGASERLETRVVSSFGKEAWYSCHFSVFTYQGEPHLLLLVVDISERKRAEEEHGRLQAHLMQAKKMDSLGNLSGGVAHDMNNVLGAIMGMTSVQLKGMAPDSPARGAFETIAEAAQRGAGMVKRLLDFARKRPAENRVLELNAMLREVTRLLERTTLNRIQFDLDLEPGLAPILGDASALANAFMNLCVNAVDAMPDGGVLTLRTRTPAPGQVEVTVGDTGTGMPEAVLAKALDPFFTTKGEGRGTGLGLAMVYSIVKAHKGTLGLASRVGEGTRVTLTFEAVAGETSLPETGAEPQAGPVQPPLDILLVDDDELVIRTTRIMLEALAHRVTCAGSGEAAIQLMESGLRPGLVLLDLNMPGLGGAGVVSWLRVIAPGLPVIVSTGHAEEAVLRLVDAEPGLALLDKPYTMDQLEAAIRALMGGAPGQRPLPA